MKNRITSKTPTFWKGVRNIAGLVALVTGTVIAAATTGGLAIAPATLTIIKIVGVVTGSVAGTAQFTKEEE